MEKSQIEFFYGGNMFVPEFFYGKFSDVEKKFKSIRSKFKSLEKVKMLYEQINQEINDITYHDDFVISLSDDFISRKMTNAYYPFIFSNYITFEEVDDSEISKWFKEKSIESQWCQLSALTTNSFVQFLYKDRDYAKRLGDSICLNWDFYMSFGESFCFMPKFQKKNNRYFFWENNTALAKLIVSVTGKGMLTLDEFEAFPSMWKKYTEQDLKSSCI